MWSLALSKLFGQKYYVWKNDSERSWTLDFSGNDLSKFGDEKVTTFRTKSWARAQKKFQKICNSLK